MRVPPFDRYKNLVVSISLFIAGAICGAALFMGIYQQNFSFLVNRNETLLMELEEAKADVKALTKKRGENSIIHQVKVIITSQNGTLDEQVENDLKKIVHNDLDIAVGKSIKVVREAPELFIKLVDGKTYPDIRGNDYRANVHMLIVVGSELSIWVRVKEYVLPSAAKLK